MTRYDTWITSSRPYLNNEGERTKEKRRNNHADTHVRKELILQRMESIFYYYFRHTRYREALKSNAEKFFF